MECIPPSVLKPGFELSVGNRYIRVDIYDYLIFDELPENSRECRSHPINFSIYLFKSFRWKILFSTEFRQDI